MSTLVSITTRQANHKPKLQTAGQLQLPIVPVLPPAVRVVINSWIRRGWNDEAACARTDNPGFYSDDLAVQTKAADQVCATCPVRRSCLASALLNDEQGVWGATTEIDRETITAKLAPLSPYWMTRSSAALPAVCRTDWKPDHPKTEMSPLSRRGQAAA
ncbi:WhiB family transcriptional regulator [Kribbella sp. NBC_00382]|uniref:WhiB family transcriptional regulator n=1 Tax=Kribbella sp. NBC_00382 TaxID=2975967 RepID=UPI002E1DDC5F